MYYCEDMYQPEINVALLDGTNESIFISDRLMYPTSLQIDLTSQRLFWADMKKHSIESVSLDGSSRRIIIDRMNTINLAYPVSIDVFEGFVYGLTRRGGHLFKVDKFGKHAPTIIKKEIAKARQVRVFQENRQLPTNAGLWLIRFLQGLK